MKTIILSILLLFAAPQQQTEYVLICNSKSSYAYHKDYKSFSDYCGGLKACKHEIKRIAKTEAVNAGRKACKKCW